MQNLNDGNEGNDGNVVNDNDENSKIKNNMNKNYYSNPVIDSAKLNYFIKHRLL
jgi:hypothetical protein